MKVLFIGGTGNISAAVSRLSVFRGIDLYLLNRGLRDIEIKGVKKIVADISNFKEINTALKDYKWDVVVNWIAFEADDIIRDIELFRNKTKQYIFISSASAYQKPPDNYLITELTPLSNPFWNYSQNKIECENILNHSFQSEGFPITIVRPSLTYDTVIPVPFGGWIEYTIIDRIKKGKKIIIHGDGTSLWTLTHSEDFARGFIGLLGNQSAIGNSFHITSDEVLTWNKIYEYVAEATGAKANVIHIPSDFICNIDKSKIGTLLGDKSYSTVFDNAKIKKYVPEFRAIIPFKDGIKQTLAWFDANPERKIINNETNRMIDKIIKAYVRQ
ncbi:MAG: NAD-dependent epimerase/dehydratase family protein [Ignavibacteriales bacterium]|nr:MAG: NAD-dependent epimerase/dehydratase family protein [Ignavibacteriales bacterium]